MVLSELLIEMRNRGNPVSEHRIRNAIKQGLVAKPRIDGSLRFDFSSRNLEEIAAYFAEKCHIPQGVSV